MTIPMKPDFSTTVVQNVELPYDDQEKFLDVSFSDPMLEGYAVKVIADTAPDGLPESRLTTIIARFPRIVLAEINTHRVFSRNSASSRARSIKTTLRDVMEAPYIPLFTKNRRGMSGEFVNTAERERSIAVWLRSRDSAVAGVLRLLLGDMIDPQLSDTDIVDEWEAWVDAYQSEVYLADSPDDRALSIHKQNVNRLLEPYMWHEAVITSSFWENFIELRADEEAMGEVAAIGFLVKEAIRASQPRQEVFHLPFIAQSVRDSLNENDVDKVVELMFQASFESAQISYADKSSLQESTASAQKGLRLLKARHMSPFEHAAVSVDGLGRFGGSVSGLTNPSRNFSNSWIQFRALTETPEIFAYTEDI